MRQSELLFNPGPLWGSQDGWAEANDTMVYLLDRYWECLASARKSAAQIHNLFETVFAFSEEVCHSSCPWCPDICCLNATVWVDFRDLLFLHLSGSPIPPAPLRTDFTEVCRYWGPRGCHLDRVSRPWICTWYLCPTQTRILRNQRMSDIDVVNDSFAAIKTLRAEMESEFIRVIFYGEGNGRKRN